MEGKKPKITTANSFTYSALIEFELWEQIQEEGESAGFGKKGIQMESLDPGWEGQQQLQIKFQQSFQSPCGI